MSNALALQCEHKVAEILAEQERAGINFNKIKSSMLILDLSEKIVALDKEAVPQLPPMMTKGNTYGPLFTKTGKVQHYVVKYCNQAGIDLDTLARGDKDHFGFSKVSFDPFDMSKTDRVKRILVEEGWQPDEWNLKMLDKDSGGDYNVKAELVTKYIQKNFIEEKSKAIKDLRLKTLKYKGKRTFSALFDFLIEQSMIPSSPKLTEDSLDTVQGTVGRLLMKRVQYSHRRSLLKGLNKRVRPDGKLSGGANPCATPTFRMKHRVVVNIPAAKSLYGKEIRGLFIGDRHDGLGGRIVDNHYVPANHEVFVGYDGAGLELRMFAHYINDPTYTEVILNGDIHSHNQALAGLPTRDDAKTFIYATLYGAGDAKIGSIINGSAKDGRDIKERFYKELPQLASIVQKTQQQALSGFLTGLDGRQVRMRRDYRGEIQTHKALNTLLQSAGAIVMKYSMIFLDQWVKEDKLRAHKVLDMHDEGQWTCHPDDVDRLRYHMDRCVAEAGKFLNLNIPLASDSMAGANWYHTH